MKKTDTPKLSNYSYIYNYIVLSNWKCTVCHFLIKLHNYFIMLQMIKSIDQPSIVRSHAYDLDLYLPIPQAQVPKQKK